jgi:XTP/dITP diphosphohydrolase
MPGRLLSELRGDNGFGYDPMFVADGQQLSNGELTAEQKDAISHRGKAVRAIVAVLVDALTGEGMDEG